MQTDLKSLAVRFIRRTSLLNPPNCRMTLSGTRKIKLLFIVYIGTYYIGRYLTSTENVLFFISNSGLSSNGPWGSTKHT